MVLKLFRSGIRIRKGCTPERSCPGLRPKFGERRNVIRRAAQRKMVIIELAHTREDLNVPPGNRLEKLKGDREGQHSIRVNDQWRICFVRDAPNADDVELTGYH